MLFFLFKKTTTILYFIFSHRWMKLKKISNDWCSNRLNTFASVTYSMCTLYTPISLCHVMWVIEYKGVYSDLSVPFTVVSFCRPFWNKPKQSSVRTIREWISQRSQPQLVWTVSRCSNMSPVVLVMQRNGLVTPNSDNPGWIRKVSVTLIKVHSI